MAEVTRIVDDKLEITEFKDVVIKTMSRRDIVDKIAEEQTKVDHLEVDLAAANTAKEKWVDLLVSFDK